MDAAKQRIRAAAALKKEEARLAQGTEGGNSSVPKSVSKVSKRKPDGDDDRPSKKTTVTPGDASPKGKSPLKPSHGMGKGIMTSTGPVIEGPCCLLTHKGYAVGEVGSFVKPTDIEPCDLVWTEDLGASTLFDLTRVCLLSQVKLILFLTYLTDACVPFFRPWFMSRLFRTIVL